jgi:hypothetical protein
MPEVYSAHPDYGFARDFKGYGEKSIYPGWPNDAKIAVSFVINYEEASHLYPANRLGTDINHRAANAPS